jgi:hypothetical protein
MRTMILMIFVGSLSLFVGAAQAQSLGNEIKRGVGNAVSNLPYTLEQIQRQRTYERQRANELAAERQRQVLIYSRQTGCADVNISNNSAGGVKLSCNDKNPSTPEERMEQKRWEAYDRDSRRRTSIQMAEISVRSNRDVSVSEDKDGTIRATSTPAPDDDTPEDVRLMAEAKRRLHQSQGH